MAKDIIAKDGAGGLYKGLSAGLLRQATYTTARLGIFQIFTDMLKQQNQGKVDFVLTPKLCLLYVCSQTALLSLSVQPQAQLTAAQHYNCRSGHTCPYLGEIWSCRVHAGFWFTLSLVFGIPRCSECTFCISGLKSFQLIRQPGDPRHTLT